MLILKIWCCGAIHEPEGLVLPLVYCYLIVL